MAATFLGPTTLGGSVVGLQSAFSIVGAALQNLRNVVAAQITAIDTAKVAVDVQIAAVAAEATEIGICAIAALATAKINIRAVAVADWQSQLDAAVAVEAQLNLDVGDPSVYLDGLLAGLAEVEANVSSLVPSIALSGQISACESIQVQLTAKIAALDLQLGALDQVIACLNAVIIAMGLINSALTVQATALVNISSALSSAIASVAFALTTYTTMSASLGTAGAFVWFYTGALSGLGAAIDAVTPASGLPGSTLVNVPVVAVQQSDSAAVAALNAIYLT